jgi:hypothetical protein
MLNGMNVASVTSRTSEQPATQTGEPLGPEHNFNELEPPSGSWDAVKSQGINFIEAEPLQASSKTLNSRENM